MAMGMHCHILDVPHSEQGLGPYSSDDLLAAGVSHLIQPFTDVWYLYV